MGQREADRELDLERVKMYFDLNKDLKVAWLVAVLFPGLLAIFAVTETWAKTDPFLALGTNIFVFVVMAFLIIRWYSGLAEVLNSVEEKLTKIQEGKPVGPLTPPRIRSYLLRSLMRRGNDIDTVTTEPVPQAPPVQTSSTKVPDILDRIREVDQRFSIWKNPTMWIWGLAGALLLFWAALLAIQTIPARGNDLTILLAVDLASYSFLFQYFEFFIRRLRSWTVEANYERFKKQERDPITQALIMMKYEAPKFRLAEVYELHPGLFTREALIERLYGKR